MIFNIGDRVRIIEAVCQDQFGGSNSDMPRNIGEEAVITESYPSRITVTGRETGVGYRLKGIPWLWDEKLLELVTENSSKRTTKHQKVINKIKQMEERRKQLGYKQYQFVTGQKEEKWVQYKKAYDFAGYFDSTYI